MTTRTILGFLLLPILIACGADATTAPCSQPGPNGTCGAGTDPKVNPETARIEARSEKTRERNPQAPTADVQALTGDGRAFGFKLYAELRKTTEKKNMFFSPHSVHTAFGMLHAGARGTTEAALASALSYSLPQDRLHAAMNKLDLELESRAAAGGSGADGNGFRLRVSNSVWAQNGFPFETPYLDTLAVNYGAGLGLVDFAKNGEAATDTINGWVEKQTEGRIKKLVAGLPRETTLVLTNAVYFNAAWQDTFAESNTKPGTFHGLDGDVTADMMNGDSYGSNMRFAKTASYDAVAVPYEGGKVELVAIAPKGGALDAYENGFDRAAFDAVVAGLSAGMVKLTIPKFEIAPETVSLKNALIALGMGEAFTEGANFAGVTPTEGFHVFDVAHKAFVKVNEKGTEAAAATAIVAGATSVPPPPTELALDRPFIFAIRDVPTGALLFVGRVVAP